MTTNLADRNCLAARAGTPPLTADEINPYLEQLDGWDVEDGKKLSKPYEFDNFVQAVDFVNRITPIAEEQDHHPDLYVRWGEVRAYLWTHSIDGLHDSDFVMAAKIDRVYEALPGTG